MVNEIKDSVNQTSEAASEIRGKVKAIQKSTDDNIAGIGELPEIISKINGLVDFVSVTLSEQS